LTKFRLLKPVDHIRLPDAFEPARWNVVFHRVSTRRWLSLIACGQFKHVSAFAYVPGFKAWLIYDTQWSGTRIMVLPHNDAGLAELRRYTAGCDVLVAQRRVAGARAPLPFLCTTAVQHLIGIPGVALRPDALYRLMLRNGAVPLGREQRTPIAGRPKPAGRAAASPE
jgi:hypothetical protein